MRAARLISVMLLSLIACGEDYVPKPKGYFRIDYPDKIYHPIQIDCPYSFEIPEYAIMKVHSTINYCWYDLIFPPLHATVHLTYQKVDGNLRQYLDDTHKLTFEHHMKASNIETEKILNKSNNIYGLIYYVSGEVASSTQFYLTDSTNHFLRGALYFNSETNPDSLKPSIDFLRADIEHLINTLEWKEN